MNDFLGNELRLGDRVITVNVGSAPCMVAGEIIKLTPTGAKVATDPVMKHSDIWRQSQILQRASHVIHLVSHNPAREEELLNPQVSV